MFDNDLGLFCLSHTSSSDFFFCLIRDKQRIEIRSEDESCRLTSPEDELTGDQEIVTGLNVMSPEEEEEEEDGSKVLLLSTESRKLYAVKLEVYELEKIKLVDKESVHIDLRYKELYKQYKTLKDRMNRIYDEKLVEQIRYAMSQCSLELKKELKKHEMAENQWQKQLKYELKCARKFCGSEKVDCLLSGDSLNLSPECEMSNEELKLYVWLSE